MKLLMIYCTRFAYKTTRKGLETAETKEEEKEFNNALVAFIQVEAEDEERSSAVETKLVKNLKWAFKKNNAESIVLHSFNHLSESKAAPDFSRELLNSAHERLVNSGYQAYQTPFGYFLDIDVKAPGESLARIFKSF